VGTEVVMPQMGYDMKEGKVVRWVKQEGDLVSSGETIAEIETDKAVIELESYASGILKRVLVPEGETVDVGRVIGWIGDAHEEVPAYILEGNSSPEAESDQTRVESSPQPSVPLGKVTPSSSQVGQVRSSPLARRLAEEKGVDLTQLTGTGPGGRVTERDVLAFEEQRKAGSAARSSEGAAGESAGRVTTGSKLVDMSRMRQAIARVVTRSRSEIPDFYITMAIDMTEAMALREQLNRDKSGQGFHVSLNDMIVKGCALALAQHPNLNASIRGNQLELHSAINIGIAIDLESNAGLVVPGLLDCGGKTLFEIAKASRDLISRANSQRLREHEYSDATFSISNLGKFGVESFEAIIFPPQAAVLAVGAMAKEPVVRDDQVVIRQILRVTLAVDHRVADGAQAARFLTSLRRIMETPSKLIPEV